jgi:hypothetical protein
MKFVFASAKRCSLDGYFSANRRYNAPPAYETPSTPTSTPVTTTAPFTTELLPVSGKELAFTEVLDDVLELLLGQVLLVPQLELDELLLEEFELLELPQLLEAFTFVLLLFELLEFEF